MGRYYVLRDGKVSEEPDHESWLAWYQSAYKEVELVAETKLANCTVTTRFLAMNLTLARDVEPQVFETKVSGGWLGSQHERFATLEEARRGHDKWVGRVREIQAENQLPPPGATW